MSDEDVLATLSRILGELIGDDSLQLTMSTRRDEVPGWDSFTYINFIVALEHEMGVKFGLAEIESFDNVGAIVNRVRQLKPR